MADTPATAKRSRRLRAASRIVGTYVANNAYSAKDLPNLLAKVCQALSALRVEPAPAAERPKPAIPRLGNRQRRNI